MATRSSPELLCPYFLAPAGTGTAGGAPAFCQCGRPTYQANISSLNAQEAAPGWRKGGGAVRICHPLCGIRRRRIIAQLISPPAVSTLFLCEFKMETHRLQLQLPLSNCLNFNLWFCFILRELMENV